MGHIAVLGAGSWGTALARHLGQRGHRVSLWARSRTLAEHVHATRVNSAYLPNVELPAAVTVTSDPGEALRAAQAAFFVVPSHGLREAARLCAPFLEPGCHVVSATKGIENGSLRLMTQVLAEELGAAHADVAALGGPSFAKEVAHGLPTAVCVASASLQRACAIRELLAGERFRVYSSDDVVGVELGGALKNVIAIAAGTADGLGFGHNARAGLITRGIAEITRLATRLGAHALTLSGLSGLGDLVLTCTGDLSRNRAVGVELGKGRGLADILGEMKMVAEGVRTADSACALARREDVDMPITTEVYNVLHQNKPALAAVESLLGRALRHERD